jgi:hypothetical protein
MTKTDQQMAVELGQQVGLKVRANSDGSVTYGATRTQDAERAASDLMSLRRKDHA